MRKLMGASGAARTIGVVVAVVLVLAIGWSANNLWLAVATTAGVMTISAIGLAMLYAAGQLSLGHAFFMAVGGYTYVYLSAEGLDGYAGLGLEPVLALVLAVLVSGLLGLCFSPISSRLGGIELAVATLGLVYLGQHVAKSATHVTGGSRGRVVDYFAIGGLTLDTPRSAWLLVAALAALAAFVAANLMRGKVGLALKALRDGELFAGSMGVPVIRSKAQIFMVSSMYAGLGGALLAITSGAIVPESFGLALSLNLLVMVVLGGSSAVVVGSTIGAVVITALPELLREHAGALPLVSNDALNAVVTPSEGAQYLYGLAVILVLVAAPGGLAEIAKRVRHRIVSVRRREAVQV